MKRRFHTNLKKFSKRNISIRIFKAGVKAALVYVAYFIFTLLTQQVYELIGEYSPFIEGFFIAIAIFVFLIEFSSGTIFKYMLEFARSLFVIFYLIIALKSGIIDVNIQNVTLVLNLQFFLLMLISINLIEIARTVLSAIDFLHERAEGELQPSTGARI